MSNTIGILLLVTIGLVFIPTTVMTVFGALLTKALVIRIEACEHKLRQIPIPGVEDEFVDDGEIDADDDSYTIPPIPNSRETNSNGILIARRQLVGDEPPAE